MKIIKTFEQYQEDWKRAKVYKPKTAVEEEKEKEKEKVNQQEDDKNEEKDQKKI